MVQLGDLPSSHHRSRVHSLPNSPLVVRPQIHLLVLASNPQINLPGNPRVSRATILVVNPVDSRRHNLVDNRREPPRASQAPNPPGTLFLNVCYLCSFSFVICLTSNIYVYLFIYLLL